MELWAYILLCSDGSYYVGSTKRDPHGRAWEHNQGAVPGYTRTRRPVTLVFAEHHERLDEGFFREQQIKRWSRAKKEALIKGDFNTLSALARSARPRGSTGSP